MLGKRRLSKQKKAVLEAAAFVLVDVLRLASISSSAKEKLGGPYFEKYNALEEEKEREGNERALKLTWLYRVCRQTDDKRLTLCLLVYF